MMERTSPTAQGWGGWKLELAGLAGVTLLQGVLILGFFGHGNPWKCLTDDRPIVSGRHALHFYHGSITARALRDQGHGVAYDPSNMAGYLKTPWFDARCQAATIFSWLASAADYQPAAYKLGLAASLVLLPVLLWAGARAAGFAPALGLLAALFGSAGCMSFLGRERIAAGDIDSLLASGLAALLLGLLIRYHTHPRPLPAMGLAATLALVCFLDPVLLALLLPVILVYYGMSGWRHSRGWHLGLAAILLAAGLASYSWVDDALATWWVRAEAPFSFGEAAATEPYVSGSGFPSSGGQDRRLWALAWLPFLGLAGLVRLRAGNETVPTAVLGLAAGLLFSLAGLCWSPFGRIAPAGYTPAVLFILALLAPQGLAGIVEGLCRLTGTRRRGLAAAGVLGLALGLALFLCARDSLLDCWRGEPLAIGLDEAQQGDVELLRHHTTLAARILLEDDRRHEGWTPLLGPLTGRWFLGGLGTGTEIEQAAARLEEGRLVGRPIQEWGDAELAEYCRWFNIGWVACRSPEAVRRFQKWTGAFFTAELPAGGKLFTLRRPADYLLAGRGRVAAGDDRRLTLEGLEAPDGIILLSFHHQPGIVPSTERVRVEREAHPFGAAPLVRLRLPGPVSRLTLTWTGGPP